MQLDQSFQHWFKTFCMLSNVFYCFFKNFHLWFMLTYAINLCSLLRAFDLPIASWNSPYLLKRKRLSKNFRSTLMIFISTRLQAFNSSQFHCIANLNAQFLFLSIGQKKIPKHSRKKKKKTTNLIAGSRDAVTHRSVSNWLKWKVGQWRFVRM